MPFGHLGKITHVATHRPAAEGSKPRVLQWEEVFTAGAAAGETWPALPSKVKRALPVTMSSLCA